MSSSTQTPGPAGPAGVGGVGGADSTLNDSPGAEAAGTLGRGAPVAGKERQASLGADAWRELRRNPIFLISLVLIAVFVVMAVRPQIFTGQDPAACSLSNSLGRPSAAHWFGFNFQGCDLFARVVHGARASILVGILVTIFTTLFGGLMGALAGYYGGWLDAVLSRVVDVFFALPLILGGVVFLTVVQLPGIWGVVLALTVLGWTNPARIMRSSVVANKNADYVQAARALGAGDGRVLTRHVLPNSLAPVIVVATISLGGFVATEATLSYLGIGLQPPAISWGIEISLAQTNFQRAPHILLFPSLFLSLMVLSFILLGDAVRDALDPKLR